MTADEIKVPIAFLLRLAGYLQWTDTEGYGPGLTAEQVRNAESAIKGYVIAVTDRHATVGVNETIRES